MTPHKMKSRTRASEVAEIKYYIKYKIKRMPSLNPDKPSAWVPATLEYVVSMCKMGPCPTEGFNGLSEPEISELLERLQDYFGDPQ